MIFIRLVSCKTSGMITTATSYVNPKMHDCTIRTSVFSDSQGFLLYAARLYDNMISSSFHRPIESICLLLESASPLCLLYCLQNFDSWQILKERFEIYALWYYIKWCLIPWLSGIIASVLEGVSSRGNVLKIRDLYSFKSFQIIYIYIYIKGICRG